MAAGVSVIICCYNSSLRITETLRHLSLQRTVPALAWEIIVVDNASTDDTEEIARTYWDALKANIKLSVVKESRPGLSHAREKGIESSAYDIILFCDDDNWLFKDYIQTSFEIMQNHPHIGAAGGMGIAVTDGTLPDWFKEYKLYASYPQAEKPGELTGIYAALYGAGMIVRKGAIEYINSLGVGFILKDRTGNSLVSGGDYELCYLLKLTGYNLWYDERLKFHHYMPPQRLTREYLIKLINGVAYSGMYLVLYHYALTGKKVTRFTWLIDVVYRVKILISTGIKTFFLRDKFKRRIAISSSWNSLKGIVHQIGTYKKTSARIERISQIKST